ncbi:hypothetical protein HDZ31DRAFT_67444 [Schizophyllum fasciatum]
MSAQNAQLDRPRANPMALSSILNPIPAEDNANENSPSPCDSYQRSDSETVIPDSPTPSVECSGAIKHFSTLEELAAFATSFPSACYCLPPNMILPQILEMFKFSLKLLWRHREGEPRVRCQCTTTDGAICGKPLLEHDPKDDRHVYPRNGRDVFCPWAGCNELLPPSLARDILDGKTVNLSMQWSTHFSAAHFRIMPLCNLCECDLMNPPNLPGGYFQRAEHLRSGWCIGLANHAMRNNIPVPLPQPPK